MEFSSHTPTNCCRCSDLIYSSRSRNRRQSNNPAEHSSAVVALRNKLIADGSLVQKDGFYLFTRDVEFSSPSAAAAVIEGGSANGLIEWRTKDGRVLKELDEQA